MPDCLLPLFHKHPALFAVSKNPCSPVNPCGAGTCTMDKSSFPYTGSCSCSPGFVATRDSLGSKLTHLLFPSHSPLNEIKWRIGHGVAVRRAKWTSCRQVLGVYSAAWFSVFASHSALNQQVCVTAGAFEGSRPCTQYYVLVGQDTCDSIRQRTSFPPPSFSIWIPAWTATSCSPSCNDPMAEGRPKLAPRWGHA